MDSNEPLLFQAIQDSNQIAIIFDTFQATCDQVLICTDTEKYPLKLVVKPKIHLGLAVEKSAAPSSLFAAIVSHSVWFQYKGDSYYFDCFPKEEDKVVYLIPVDGLFRQQRRQEFRYPISREMIAIFEIKSVEHRTLSVKDVSETGLHLIAPTKQDFKIGEHIVGDLKIGAGPSLTISTEVRHSQIKGNEQNVGLRIDHEIFKSLAKMNELLLFLQVENYYYYLNSK